MDDPAFDEPITSLDALPSKQRRSLIIRTASLTAASASVVVAYFLATLTPETEGTVAVRFVVPLVVVLFAALHVLLSRSDAGAYSEQLDHIGGLYYSMTTASTIGFGDVSAVSDGARVAVMVQIVMQVVAIGFALRLALASVRARELR